MELFQALADEVGELYMRWEMFEQLYGSTKYAELVKETAPLFFEQHYRLLTEAVGLGLRRLLDPAQTRGKKNMSLEALLDTIPDGADTALLRRQLEGALEDIRLDCEHVKQWCNRRIAHFDLDTRFLEHPNPLKPVQVKTVKLAIGNMQGLLQEFAKGMFDGLIVPMVTRFADGVTLMRLLDEGHKQVPRV